MNEKENRYTRLKAIEAFGYNLNWDDLRKFHIGIVGVGGLGTVSSEMVTRCGVRKLTLFDFDTVDVVNLNRHMYKIEDIGQPKVEVAAKLLKKINPDVDINFHNKDIMALDFESLFEEEIKKLDIILNGLDNVPAREYLNIKCINFNIPYIDAGASRSGMNGFVHPIIPYKTSCAICINRFANDVLREKGEPCVASLPSTMAILASIQFQEMLKYLLKFGISLDYLVYNMVDGSFTKYTTSRDENCPICGANVKNKIKKFKTKIKQEELDELVNKLKQK